MLDTPSAVLDTHLKDVAARDGEAQDEDHDEQNEIQDALPGRDR